MALITKLKYLLILFAVICISSCSDSHEPTQPMDSLEPCVVSHIFKTRTYISADSLPNSSSSLEHQTLDNRIIESIESNQIKRIYTYNADDQLTLVEKRVGSIYKTEDSIIYKNSKIFENYIATDFYTTHKQIFNWNNENLQSGTIELYDGQDLVGSSMFSFTYQNGNIVEYNNRDNSNELFRTVTYEYDDKINYLKYLYFVPNLWIYNSIELDQAPFWFSKNNVTKESKFNSEGELFQEAVYEYQLIDNKVSRFIKTRYNTSSPDTSISVYSILYSCN